MSSQEAYSRGLNKMVEHIVVVGCGAAGATAALQARKFNRTVEISIFNTEPYSQYSRCGLPYTISGNVGTFDDLVLMPPDNWGALKIDAHIGVTVTDIDHKSKEIVFSGEGGEGKQRDGDKITVKIVKREWRSVRKSGPGKRSHAWSHRQTAPCGAASPPQSRHTPDGNYTTGPPAASWGSSWTDWSKAPSA